MNTHTTHPTRAWVERKSDLLLLSPLNLVGGNQRAVPAGPRDLKQKAGSDSGSHGDYQQRQLPWHLAWRYLVWERLFGPGKERPPKNKNNKKRTENYRKQKSPFPFHFMKTVALGGHVSDKLIKWNKVPSSQYSGWTKNCIRTYSNDALVFLRHHPAPRTFSGSAHAPLR